MITTKDFYSPRKVRPGFIHHGVSGKRRLGEIDERQRSSPSLKKIKRMSGKVEYPGMVRTTRFYFCSFRSNV